MIASRISWLGGGARVVRAWVYASRIWFSLKCGVAQAVECSYLLLHRQMWRRCFAGGVPGFTPVPSPTLPTLDTRCERVSTGRAWRGSPDDFGSHQVPCCRVDDRLVVTSHIVLGHLALVGLDGLGQEISSEGFLQQGIAFVFLVGQDRADRGG